MKVQELETIADGVAPELFAAELARVASNIIDQNTSPTAKRSITLKFTFAPDENRDEAKVMVDVTAKLAPLKPYGKTVFIGKNNGKAGIYDQDTKQIDMLDHEVTTIQGVKNA